MFSTVALFLITFAIGAILSVPGMSIFTFSRSKSFTVPPTISPNKGLFILLMVNLLPSVLVNVPLKALVT